MVIIIIIIIASTSGGGKTDGVDEGDKVKPDGTCDKGWPYGNLCVTECPEGSNKVTRGSRTACEGSCNNH